MIKMSNIGVVFSGGTAKGAYQIGFSKALLEKTNANDKICVVGSSVGALSAFVLGTGQTQIAEKLMLLFNVKGMYSVFKLIKNNTFYDFIDKISEYEIQQNRDVHIALCESSSLKVHYINLNSLPKSEIKNALKASIAVPKLTKAVNVNGQPFVDAAIMNNVPIDFFLGKEAECIFVVHFDSKVINGNNIIEFQFSNELERASPTYDMRREKMQSMFFEGYNITKDFLDICFPNGLNCFDNIIQPNTRVRKFNADYLMNMLNVLTQKFVGSK